MIFTKSVCDNFMPSYLPIVRKRKNLPYNENQRYWQLLRRGRYIEFNLLYDRGVKFGLVPGGKILSNKQNILVLLTKKFNIFCQIIYFFNRRSFYLSLIIYIINVTNYYHNYCYYYWYYYGSYIYYHYYYYIIYYFYDYIVLNILVIKIIFLFSLRLLKNITLPTSCFSLVDSYETEIR